MIRLLSYIYATCTFQTYDLLRVCVGGFLPFCEDFLQDHPGYYLLPMKLNGSAVETLFSQMKYNANGKLTSTNFETAKKAILLKRDVNGHHASGKGYRDVPIYTQEMPLRKKDTRRAIQYEFE